LKSRMSEPSIFLNRGNELSLSGPALAELIQAVLDKETPFRFRAKGISMRPFIRHGDVITISPLSGNLPRCGDVVAFFRPVSKRLVVHRVVGRSDGFLLIKGDNAARDDGFIPTANILGCVTKVERNGKEVYLGLGPERFLIAFLTRRGLLFPLLLPMWKLARPIIGKWLGRANWRREA
jgi:signal peptidase I